MARTGLYYTLAKDCIAYGFGQRPSGTPSVFPEHTASRLCWPFLFTPHFLAGSWKPDWRKFRKYAKRVRQLSNSFLPSEPGSTLDPETLLFLLSCPPQGRGPLLPNIHQLTWETALDPTSVSLVLPFLSPSLKHFNLLTRHTYAADIVDKVARTLPALAARVDIQLVHLGLDVAIPKELNPVVTACQA